MAQEIYKFVRVRHSPLLALPIAHLYCERGIDPATFII